MYLVYCLLPYFLRIFFVFFGIFFDPEMRGASVVYHQKFYFCGIFVSEAVSIGIYHPYSIGMWYKPCKIRATRCCKSQRKISWWSFTNPYTLKVCGGQWENGVGNFWAAEGGRLAPGGGNYWGRNVWEALQF